MRRDDVFALIDSERNRQVEKWGNQVQPHEIWMVILGEEIGEASEEILNVIFQDKSEEDLRTELIQAAAVIVSWIEDKF